MVSQSFIDQKGLGFSTDPTFDVLLDQLSRLAGEWRETKSNEPVIKYQAILRSLLQMGWNEELDIELVLPIQFMPREYLER